MGSASPVSILTLTDARRKVATAALTVGRGGSQTPQTPVYVTDSREGPRARAITRRPVKRWMYRLKYIFLHTNYIFDVFDTLLCQLLEKWALRRLLAVSLSVRHYVGKKK